MAMPQNGFLPTRERTLEQTITKKEQQDFHQ